MKTFAFIILLFASTAMADEKVVGHPIPFANELLQNKITLTNNCSNVSIVEWKNYSFSKEDISIIDSVCNNVVNKFYPFIYKHGLKNSKDFKPFYAVSLLPWDETFDGKGYRNLNDYKFRFADRPAFCDTNGRECLENESPLPFRGWTDLENQFHFLRNDPIKNGKPNPAFAAAFAHELFHQMSWESGTFESHGSVETEENMAKLFTKELGYGNL